MSDELIKELEEAHDFNGLYAKAIKRIKELEQEVRDGEHPIPEGNPFNERQP